jgi:hypothetical protein
MKVVYHTTKQCEENASRKYSIDDGESEMLLCGGCFQRCLTKKNKNSSWLGFFDCSYPPDAKVKGSSWYYWMLSNAPADVVEGEEEELCEGMAKCSLSEQAEAQVEAEEEIEVEEAQEEAQEEVQEEVQEEAEEEVQEEAQEEVHEVQEPSPAEKIKARIVALQAFVKASRAMPVKEQAKILKEIINLRTELKKIN